MDRLGAFLGDREAQLVGDAHRAQHAHRVLAVTQLRVADQAQAALAQVLDAAGEVDDGEVADVVVQRVDGEVAAERILLQRAVDVVGQDAPGLVALVALGDRPAESGDLEDLLAHAHVGDEEAAPDQAAGAEQAADLIRMRAGGDVEVFRLDPGQQVAHAAADHVGLMTGVLEAVQHLHRARRQVGARDGVLVPGDAQGFARRLGNGRLLVLGDATLQLPRRLGYRAYDTAAPLRQCHLPLKYNRASLPAAEKEKARAGRACWSRCAAAAPGRDSDTLRGCRSCMPYSITFCRRRRTLPLRWGVPL